MQLQVLLKELRQTQAELIQAEKMSSLGQMVAGIAHEINNPVSFIHGNLTFAEAYTFDLHGRLPLIECYAGQLNQVFFNLLANAIDAVSSHPSKPQLIQIQTRRIDPDWVQIQISDTGTGISEAVRSRIFNPFFTTKPVGQGTGMGLAISYQIITKNHGGKIECLQAESGTKFVVQLPCCQTYY